MKTIIEMARESGGYFAELPKGDVWLFDNKEQLEAFAALVRADEREELLDIVYSYADSLSWNDDFQAAIRARGQA
jgi:hypothetical protein